MTDFIQFFFQWFTCKGIQLCILATSQLRIGMRRGKWSRVRAGGGARGGWRRGEQEGSETTRHQSELQERPLQYEHCSNAWLPAVLHQDGPQRVPLVPAHQLFVAFYIS